MKNNFIYLWWYTDKPNVGDFASYYVVRNISSAEIIYKDPRISLRIYIKRFIKSLFCFKFYRFNLKNYVMPWQKCYMSIGSNLDFSNYKVVNWGGGFREYDSKPKGSRVVAVRGKLSQKIVANSNLPIGDPAILLPLITDGYYPCPSRKKIMRNISVVPHFNDYDDFSKICSHFNVLDVRTCDLINFVNEIKKSDCVLSSSLHGIIIAHSYGIPALWIRKNYVDSGMFKYHDYFSSVGIDLYDGFDNINEIFENTESVNYLFSNYSNYSLPHSELIYLANDLIRSAPFRIKPDFELLVKNILEKECK